MTWVLFTATDLSFWKNKSISGTEMLRPLLCKLLFLATASYEFGELSTKGTHLSADKLVQRQVFILPVYYHGICIVSRYYNVLTILQVIMYNKIVVLYDSLTNWYTRIKLRVFRQRKRHHLYLVCKRRIDSLTLWKDRNDDNQSKRLRLLIFFWPNVKRNKKCYIHLKSHVQVNKNIWIFLYYLISANNRARN